MATRAAIVASSDLVTAFVSSDATAQPVDTATAELCTNAMRTEWARRKADPYADLSSSQARIAAGDAFFNGASFRSDVVPQLVARMSAAGGDWRSPAGSLGIPNLIGLPVWTVFAYDALESMIRQGLTDPLAATQDLCTRYGMAVLAATQKRAQGQTQLGLTSVLPSAARAAQEPLWNAADALELRER